MKYSLLEPQMLAWLLQQSQGAWKSWQLLNEMDVIFVSSMTAHHWKASENDQMLLIKLGHLAGGRRTSSGNFVPREDQGSRPLFQDNSDFHPNTAHCKMNSPRSRTQHLPLSWVSWLLDSWVWLLLAYCSSVSITFSLDCTRKAGEYLQI